MAREVLMLSVNSFKITKLPELSVLGQVIGFLWPGDENIRFIGGLFLSREDAGGEGLGGAARRVLNCIARSKRGSDANRFGRSLSWQSAFPRDDR